MIGDCIGHLFEGWKEGFVLALKKGSVWGLEGGLIRGSEGVCFGVGKATCSLVGRGACYIPDMGLERGLVLEGGREFLFGVVSSNIRRRAVKWEGGVWMGVVRVG